MIMDSPYHIKGPAMVSFSGGRTSGYMLFKIAEAFQGNLPADVVVSFANTGKEREETLRFVQECGSRFGVRIRWVEWRDRSVCFEEVGYNSASRNGEPFEALIRKKQRLPNWQERWCTSFLKLKPMFALAEWFGWQAGQYSEIIGLRNDEGHRILKGLDNAEKDGRKILYPLAKAKVEKADVMEFWRRMDFDLGLSPYEGNCDFCFLKGRGIKKRIIRDGRADPAWWIRQEVEQSGFFDRRDRMAGLVEECRRAPELFDDPDEFEYDAECGLTCEPVE
jgi:3'-phosphoadenosine 5'-phosphosulfate sulfotransferase (PAPS reductase)/FAD synthetase